MRPLIGTYISLPRLDWAHKGALTALTRAVSILALASSLILPSFGLASARVVNGAILVPTGGSTRPQRCFHSLVGDPLQGATGWVLEATPGEHFSLSARSDNTRLNDFDIYFFSELPACQDSAAAVGFTSSANETGTVPSARKFAVIVLAVGTPGAAFSYVEEPSPTLTGPIDISGTFEPKPVSRPIYATKPPSEDPDRQEKFIEAADGVSLYVETWLPVLKDGNDPAKHVPTILIATPYLRKGAEEYPGAPGFIEYMTSRGFAVAQHHVRGTGESGGCIEQTSNKQIDDGARIIEYVGRDAPWSNGNVGMYGISYDAETQLSVAGRGDPSKTKYLKAIVPVASVGGQYEYSNRDGVPFELHGFESNLTYFGLSAVPGMRPVENDYPGKAECQQEMLIEPLDMSGDLRPFWKDREYRPDAANIRAATLWVHGFADFNVEPITIAGYFDRLPSSTPKKGLFGIWNHAFPDSHSSVEPTWARADWLPMVTAWFDHYLKNIPGDVESWPPVQVQASDGTWRSEPRFPTTGGPVGQLALAPTAGWETPHQRDRRATSRSNPDYLRMRGTEPCSRPNQ